MHFHSRLDKAEDFFYEIFFFFHLSAGDFSMREFLSVDIVDR